MPGLSHPIILGIVLATLQSKTVNITNVTYLSSVFCALYTRGNEQGEAVTHKCPNYQHGIIALSIALALAGATWDTAISYINKNIVYHAKEIHVWLMANHSRSCFYNEQGLCDSIIDSVIGYFAGSISCANAAKSIISMFVREWIEAEIEMMHWAFACRLRPQVARMILNEAYVHEEEEEALALFRIMELLGYTKRDITREASGLGANLKSRYCKPVSLLNSLHIVSHNKWSKKEEEIFEAIAKEEIKAAKVGLEAAIKREAEAEANVHSAMVQFRAAIEREERKLDKLG